MLQVDSEDALRTATGRFSTRFRAMEALAEQRGIRMDALSLDELDVLWDEVKRDLAADA